MGNKAGFPRPMWSHNLDIPCKILVCLNLDHIGEAHMYRTKLLIPTLCIYVLSYSMSWDHSFNYYLAQEKDYSG